MRDSSIRKEPTAGIQKDGKSLAGEIQKEPTGGVQKHGKSLAGEMQKHGKSLAGAIREEPSRRDTETRIQVNVNKFTGTGKAYQSTREKPARPIQKKPTRRRQKEPERRIRKHEL